MRKLYEMREYVESGLFMSRDGFFHIIPPERFIDKCAEIADSMDNYSFNEKTFDQSREGKICGIMGEYAFQKVRVLRLNGKEYVPHRWVGTKIYDYDWEYVAKEDSSDIIKIDVKTKRRSGVPDLNFDCSVSEYQLEFDVDYYVFASIEYNKESSTYGTITYCGIISKSEILGGLENGRTKFWNKGETDDSNGLTFKSNTINMSYSNLISPRGVFYPYDPQLLQNQNSQ